MALNRSTEWVRVLAIFVLCFLLRVLVGGVLDAAIPVIKRADVYSDIAANLTRGYGFVAEPGGEPITWRAPLYPAFLAVLYRLFGEHNGTAVFIAQAMLDSITGVLIYWMGTRLFSESVGFFSAAMFALNPLSAYYSLRFMSEPLFTLAITATIAACVWSARTSRSVAFIVVGALVGVAALVKPVALGLWPCLAAWALFRLRNVPRRAMAAVMALTISCLLILAPWMIRNYQVTGRVLAVATGGGYALWLGNQMVSHGHEDWEVDDETRAYLFELRNAVFATAERSDFDSAPVPRSGRMHTAVLPINISVEEDEAFQRAAWKEIASHPFDSALLTVRKFFRFWFRIFLPANRWAQSYVLISQTLLLAFAALGLMEARRRGGILFLLLPVAFLTVAHSLTYATIRYSIPVLPAITIFSMVGVRGVVHALNEKLGLSIGVSLARSILTMPLGNAISSYRKHRQ